jgi:hypothetical protein
MSRRMSIILKHYYYYLHTFMGCGVIIQCMHMMYNYQVSVVSIFMSTILLFFDGHIIIEYFGGIVWYFKHVYSCTDQIRAINISILSPHWCSDFISSGYYQDVVWMDLMVDLFLFFKNLLFSTLAVLITFPSTVYEHYFLYIHQYLLFLVFF